MKTGKILSLIFVGIFLISSISAFNAWAYWQDESSSIDIYNGEQVQFTANAGDIDSPIYVGVKLYKNGNLIYTFRNEKVVNDNNFSKTYTINPSIYGGSGNYELKVSGHQGSSYDTDTINLNVMQLDSKIPQITIQNPANGALVNTNPIQMIYSITDNGNLFPCQYSLDGGVTKLSLGCYSTTQSINVAEGLNTITIYAEDDAGNVAQRSRTFTVDTISPLLNIAFPLNGNQVSGSEFISFSDDEVTSPQCSIDNSAWVPCTSGATQINALNGFNALANATAFTLYVRDTDAAGNVGTDSETGIIKNVGAVLDTNAPVITITFPLGTDYDSGITILNYAAVDAEGNLNLCWYSKNLGVTNSTAVACSGSFSITSTEGINRWTVYASDIAGNIGSDLVTFRVDTSNDDDDDNDSSNKKVTFVYDDPDRNKYEAQTQGTVSTAIDLATPVQKSWFVRFIEAIINFFRWLFS